MRASLESITVALLTLMTAGCVATSGLDRANYPLDDQDSPITVERGRPDRVIDGTGWILGIPSKIALWDRRADNHDISPQTEAQVVAYLEEQNLPSVLVRINQYDPLGEWKRLATNQQVGFGWRVTAGTIETLKYTLLPGRLLGEDWYNPFTNTVNLYSDIPSLGLVEAAYAKDVSQRRYPGAYATAQLIPIVGMWHETIATREVLRQVSAQGTDIEREEAYRVLYPSYGGNWGAGVGSFIPFGNAYGRLGGAVLGHAANGVRKLVPADTRAKELPAD